MAQEPVIHPAEDSDPDPGPPGEKPYEMAGRELSRPVLFDLQDVSGRLVEGHDAEGWLYRSEDQKLFGDACAKLVYVGNGPNPRLVVRPETPITIPDPWDALNFWNYGNNWGWAPDPQTPPLRVAAMLRDASGWEFAIPLGSVNYKYWFLMNGRLQADQSARLQRPVQFVGLEFTNARNTERRTIYLGPCEFFQEEWKPLSFQPWPEKLPFPTREETILPTNDAAYENEVTSDGDATVFTYRGDDCTLAYRVTPGTGTLGDVELLHNGKAVTPCSGGGLRIVTAEGILEPDSPDVQRTLTDAALQNGVLTTSWRLEAGDVATTVTYRFRILQKSLIVEIEADQPVVERVALGRAQPVSEPKLFKIPYLTYGGNDPRVLYADGLFYFLQFDWYHSDASVLEGSARVGPDWAACNGAATYIPKTDGVRNLVRERLFITASPRVEEVLPTIANPASPMREQQAHRLWRVRSGSDHALEIADAARLRRYGCEHVTVRYHENSWRDAGESFTFRTQAAPGRGGDQALRDFVAGVQALGWRVGLYTNYTDYAPVNSYWNEDWVSRHPDGNWQRAWMRCYAPKPMRAVEMEAILAPQIQAKFGENHSYCDVHTAVSPFSRVDYDHRVPGAGTFRRTFECFGRLLYNEKFAHKGPVYSEGRNHWWYAGLTDGNYAQIISGSPPKEPLLVAFDLLKMHPLQMDAGMGAPGMFFRGAPGDLDQFVATSLAYGHIGFVDWGDLHGTLRIYYMMQQLQSHYVMIPVARIEYDDGGKFVDTSEALISGAYLEGRVHVVYENGTEVWANASDRPWVISLGDTGLTLPKWGYAAGGGAGPQAATCYSAVVPAAGPDASRGPRRHVSYSHGPEQKYVDSPDGFAFLGGLAAEGSGALRLEDGRPYVIRTDQFADFAFRPDQAGLDPARNIRAAGEAEDGSTVEDFTVRWSRGMVHIIPGEAPAQRYALSQADGPAPPALKAPILAPRGSEVKVTLPADAKLSGDLSWEVGGERTAATATRAEDVLTVRLPEDVAPASHLWLAVPVGHEPLWVDFIAVEPIDVSLDIELPARLAVGEKLSGFVSLVSNLPREADVQMAFAPEGVSFEPADATVALAVGSRHRQDVAVALPDQPGRYELAVLATEGNWEARVARPVSAIWEYPTLLDLTDPTVDYVKGYCPRGGEETMGGETMFEGSFQPTQGVSGGVPRACIFSHPPFGARKTGYVFGIYDLTLPANRQTFLEFWMGMRDGLDRTDGVTFRVMVTDQDGTETRVFSQHHQAISWQEAEVDLSAFAGKAVKLKLVADCGPNDDTTADHALWGDAKAVVRDARARTLLVTAAD